MTPSGITLACLFCLFAGGLIFGGLEATAEKEKGEYTTFAAIGVFVLAIVVLTLAVVRL